MIYRSSPALELAAFLLVNMTSTRPKVPVYDLFNSHLKKYFNKFSLVENRLNWPFEVDSGAIAVWKRVQKL